VAFSNEPQDSDYHINSIPTIAHIQRLITSQSAIPVPAIYKTDTSLDIVPFHYILSSSPPPGSITLSEARTSNRITPEANAKIDLQIGLYLRQLHAIQNDWFGIPLLEGKEPREPSYSWQESFTLFLETVLTKLESRPANELGLDISFERIRRFLSRAIGSFLFDDAEVPSLTGFTLSYDDVLISLPSNPQPGGGPGTIFFPLPTHAIWADPMLETLFMPPGPSQALLEGYTDGEGPLIVFPRQRTKRIWYTIFLACVVLVEGGGEDEAKVKWARELLREHVDKLEDAPCY
jgi:hypothetical protein